MNRTGVNVRSAKLGTTSSIKRPINAKPCAKMNRTTLTEPVARYAVPNADRALLLVQISARAVFPARNCSTPLIRLGNVGNPVLMAITIIRLIRKI